MTLESVEKLRELVKSFHSLKSRWDTLEAIDEVEREIERDYMRLPVDADGVPIHCGERMRLDNGHEGDVWLIGVFDIMMSDHTCFDWAKSRHVKPRTIEDVLRDVWKEAIDYAKSDIWRNPDEVFAERADEIRELMGGDA